MFSRNAATLYSLLAPSQARAALENDLKTSYWLGGKIDGDSFILRARAPSPTTELLIAQVSGRIASRDGGCVIVMHGALRRAQKIYHGMWLIVFIVISVLLNTGGTLAMTTAATVPDHKILPGMVIPPILFFFFASYFAWIYFSSVERVKTFLRTALDAVETDPNDA